MVLRIAMQKPEVRQIELELTDLSRGGSAVGRGPDGAVVFVPYGAPGDLVRVELTAQKKRFWEGKILEIIRPSEGRVAPQCAYFTQCGGCRWQHLPYKTQLNTKLNGLTQALRRAGLTQEELQAIPIESFSAPEAYAYRNRIQLHGQDNLLGYYAHHSKILVPIDRCEIADERLNNRLNEIKNSGALKSQKTSPYKLELSLNAEGQILESWNKPHGALGFRQINDRQNTVLKNWVSQQLPTGGCLVDLYGGSGNFSLEIKENFEKVVCVDIGAPKVAPQVNNNYEFVSMPVEKWLKRIPESFQKKCQTTEQNVAITDPPRDGLAQETESILGAFKKLKITQWVHIGCDPDSFSKDVATAIKMGWNVKKMAVFDLFPQTPHLESVAVLIRSCQTR